MKAVVQRVSSASVTIDGRVVGRIDRGLLILLGISPNDTEADGEWLAQKTTKLRIFPDDTGEMARNITEVTAPGHSGMLVISQFTLFASVRKGTRPSVNGAAAPEIARPLYERFLTQLETALGGRQVERGEFGAMMQVALVNDGPVTLLIDTHAKE